MPADRSGAACAEAGVRKPPKKEPAGNCGRWRRERRAMEICARRKCVRATDAEECAG